MIIGRLDEQDRYYETSIPDCYEEDGTPIYFD